MRSQRIAHEMRYLANALQKYYPECRSKYIILAAIGAIADMFKFCQMAHFCSNRCHTPTWYSAKHLWRVARERGFLITSGLKSNRWLLLEDPTAPKGWSGPRLSDSTAQLQASDYVQPANTDMRNLFLCHVSQTLADSFLAMQVDQAGWHRSKE